MNKFFLYINKYLVGLSFLLNFIFISLLYTEEKPHQPQNTQNINVDSSFLKNIIKNPLDDAQDESLDQSVGKKKYFYMEDNTLNLHNKSLFYNSALFVNNHKVLLLNDSGLLVKQWDLSKTVKFPDDVKIFDLRKNQIVVTSKVFNYYYIIDVDGNLVSEIPFPRNLFTTGDRALWTTNKLGLIFTFRNNLSGNCLEIAAIDVNKNLKSLFTLPQKYCLLRPASMGLKSENLISISNYGDLKSLSWLAVQTTKNLLMFSFDEKQLLLELSRLNLRF